MKRASWVLRAISLLAILASASCTQSIDGEPRAIHFTQAQLAVTAPGQLDILPPKALGQLPPLTWTTIPLPHKEPRAVAPEAVELGASANDSITAWYRMVVPPSNVTEQLSAVYLARWHTWGNIAIYANGVLIYSSLEDGVWSSFNQPLLIRLPFTPESNHALELIVRMDSVRVVGAALSSLWVGPVVELRPRYAMRHLLQARVPQITSAIFIILGFFALSFWARRRHETTNLLFFLLSVLFFFRNLHYYIEDMQFSERWFSWLTVNSLGWLMIVVYLFAFRFHGQRYRILEWLLVGAMVVASTLSLPLGWADSNLTLLGPLTYLIYIAVGFGVTILLSYASWRARSIECAVLSGILWLNLGLGVHDWLLQNWRINIESIYLMPFGAIALFAMFLSTVLRRYVTALSDSENASAVLALRLSDRERDLRSSYSKLREVEQAQLLSEERQRLMREMHDGLGSALMSSLVAVERGQMQPSDIAQVLRECVDDLKLTIDSLEPVGDDLLILLATLRYRLDPRLEAAGIKLSWEIQPVPTLTWLNPSSALQILRMLQEILTNVLKHAQAQSIRVATTVHANEIIIIVADDGMGFDTQSTLSTGRGLPNLQRRAAEIGASTTIDSTPKGTTVQIRLPITRAL